VYRLVCKGTIEERILELGAVKLDLDSKVSKQSDAKVEKELIKYIKNM